MQATDVQDFLNTLSARLTLIPPWAVVLICFAVVVSLQRVLARKLGLHSSATPFLDPDQWKALPLVDKVVINHNTRRFRYVCSSVWVSTHCQRA